MSSFFELITLIQLDDIYTPYSFNAMPNLHFLEKLYETEVGNNGYFLKLIRFSTIGILLDFYCIFRLIYSKKMRFLF